MPPCCRQMWLKLTDLCTLLIVFWAYHTPQYWVNWKLIPWWGKRKGITIHCQLFQEDFPYSDTYKIGQFSHFNDQLNNTKRRYTFFVPRDKGWQKTELDYPSVHKKLFMADFSYHVSYICHCPKGLFIYSTLHLQSKNLLERHLVIADHAYTMKDLVQLSLESNSVVLPTYRDSLEVKVEEEAGRKYH